MIKDKLHTIGDKEAEELARILLKSLKAGIYEFVFKKITRRKYDPQEGTDAEESVNVYFDANVKNEAYKSGGWKDNEICVNIIESDRYHGHPYFSAISKEPEDKFWKSEFLANQIEAVEYLQRLKLL